MNSTAEHLLGRNWRTPSLIGILALTFGGLLYALATKGMWYDEVWTLFMADPDRSLGQAYAQRWIYDIHPPFYYAWSRLAEEVNSQDIRLIRLLNMVPAVLLLGYAWLVARRRHELRHAVWLAVLLFLTNPLVFDVFIQARSYFSFLCAWLIACLGMLYATLRDKDLGRTDAAALAGMTVGIFFSLTLHYYCAVLVAVMIPVQAGALWLGGKRKWAVAVLLAAFGSGLVITGAALAQWSTLREIGGHFWASTSLAQAIAIEAQTVVFALGLNIVAIGAFLTVVAPQGAGPVALSPTMPARRFALAIMLSIALALLFTLCFNGARPMLVRQYLLPIMAPAAVAIAAVIAPLAWRNRALFLAVLVNALLLVAVSTWRRSHVQDMNALASWIGRTVATCPTTRVVAMAPWDFAGQRVYLMVNERKVSALGYRALGQRYGFVAHAPDEAVAAPARCPVIIWSERIGGPVPDIATLARRAHLRLPPGGTIATREVRSESGIVVVATR